MKHNIIVAVCNGNGIGHSNKLPWYYKEELRNFSKVTKGNGNNAIIMGKNTWESLPKRPLPGRINIVLSSSFNCIASIDYPGTWFCNSLQQMLSIPCIKYKELDECWYIGGEVLYNTMIKQKVIDNLLISKIPKDFECDRFFPEIPSYFKLTSESTMVTEDNTNITVCKYENTEKLHLS